MKKHRDDFFFFHFFLFSDVQSRLFGYLSVCTFMIVDIVFEVWLLLYFINALRVFFASQDDGYK